MSEKDKLDKTGKVPGGNKLDELSDDALNLITGGANPFADVARVPNAKIDKNVRDKA